MPRTARGIDKLVATIGSHRDHLITSGELEERRRKILEMRILKVVEDIVRSRLLGQGRGQLDRLITEAMSGDIDPYSAARILLELGPFA